MQPDDEAELAKLELRIRQLRARRAQFKRQMMQADRRREAQRLCTLGRALVTLSDRNPEWHDRNLMPFLRAYISRDVDRDVLSGTRFDVSVRDDSEVTT